MLDDHIHRVAIGSWLALAIILSAGLVQAVVSDDINDRAGIEDQLLQETNATSEVAGGVANDSENFTEALVQIDNGTELNDTTTIDESLNDSANESLNEPITVAAPETVEEGAEVAIRSVCLNGCNFTTIQAAIEAAGDGAVIEVGSGTYNEKIVLEKRSPSEVWIPVRVSPLLMPRGTVAPSSWRQTGSSLKDCTSPMPAPGPAPGSRLSQTTTSSQTVAS